MAEEVILSWNVTNWVTVVIMAVLGFALLGAVVKIVKNRKAA
jgi:hypothetical protein